MYIKITEYPQHNKVWSWNKVGQVYKVDWVKRDGYWILKVCNKELYIDADECRPYHKES